MPRDVRKKWLRVAVLGSCTALAACLFWGSLGGDEGITEVLAHRSEILPGRFIEVPCSEDYDSHRRFEGTQCQGDSGKSSMLTWNSVCSKCVCFYFDELVGIGLKVVWGGGGAGDLPPHRPPACLRGPGLPGNSPSVVDNGSHLHREFPV